MHYNLLFNGCSFTAGAELGGVEQDINFRDKHRYSHVVAEKTGLSYANISEGGSSNFGILRRTVEWFEEGNTCDHAIIQWTLRGRVDHVDEYGEFFSVFPTASILKTPSRLRSITKKRQSYWDHYKHIQTHANDQHNEDMCMYWMDYFLKNKCSLFYLKLGMERKNVPEKYYEISTYYKYRNKPKLPYLIQDILLDKSTDYCSPIPGTSVIGNHPNVQGHKRIADYILENDSYFK